MRKNITYTTEHGKTFTDVMRSAITFRMYRGHGDTIHAVTGYTTPVGPFTATTNGVVALNRR